MTLSTRAEAARPEETAGLVSELWRRIGEYEWEDGIVWRQLLDINTPESLLAAVMMLEQPLTLPDRLHEATRSVGRALDLHIRFAKPEDDYVLRLALALIAAIAKSKGI